LGGLLGVRRVLLWSAAIFTIVSTQIERFPRVCERQPRIRHYWSRYGYAA
jgi:hypothetical protein